MMQYFHCFLHRPRRVMRLLQDTRTQRIPLKLQISWSSWQRNLIEKVKQMQTRLVGGLRGMTQKRWSFAVIFRWQADHSTAQLKDKEMLRYGLCWGDRAMCTDLPPSKQWYTRNYEVPFTQNYFLTLNILAWNLRRKSQCMILFVFVAPPLLCVMLT